MGAEVAAASLPAEPVVVPTPPPEPEVTEIPTLTPVPKIIEHIERIELPNEADLPDLPIAPEDSQDQATSSLPWWTFLLFGVVVIALAVAFFAYTTRCPCEERKAAKSVSFVEPEASKQEAKPFVEAAADLKSTAYVLSWMGDASPSETLKVHFLLSAKPYTTYSCTARGIFGVHGRVRITLPKGGYAVRAVFGDGTQAVAHDVPANALVTLTETTLKAEAMSEPLAASEVPTGVCTRDDEK